MEGTYKAIRECSIGRIKRNVETAYCTAHLTRSPTGDERSVGNRTLAFCATRMTSRWGNIPESGTKHDLQYPLEPPIVILLAPALSPLVID